MKAVLMAAGVGSRISRYVNRPKSTLDVGGQPLIRRTVEMLEAKGVEVAVVTGFQHETIEKALEGLDVKFYNNPFFRVTNSIASLWFARDFVKGDDIILANADVYWDTDIFDALASDGREVVMLGDESRVDNGDYFFGVEDGRIVRYGKQLRRDERTTEYVGIAKIRASVLPDFIAHLCELIDLERYDLWWENVLYEYLDKTPVCVRDVSDMFWAEIDYIDDYARIKRFLETGDVGCKNLCTDR
jgi:choline kinase